LIKKFISRVLGRSREPKVIPFEAHGVSRDQISYGARKVCEVLQGQGFTAYVVGGAVRDLMLGVQPKDFDVATDAHPEEVHRLIRRSRMIGRRFKLVHAVFNDEIVEVSTFRSSAPAEVDEESGRVLRDNVFGNREQDAARRDFTVNALYYDPANETVLDYHRGVADLKKRTLRIIGDPRVRFREDPVRMLRAVRLAAKLDFSIDAKTRTPIKEMAPLLDEVPPARVFDEMLKLLLSGHASACLHRLRGEGLHHGVLPLLDVILEQPLGERFVNLALQQTDERIRTDRPVSPAFLFAALLWHEVLAAWKAREARGEKPVPALYEAMDDVLDKQTDKLAIPRRLTTTIKEIWSVQPRFEQRSGRRPYAVLEHPRFRAAFDFMMLRAESGEASGELVEWWRRFQDATYDERADMLLPAPAGEKKKRRRRRRGGTRGEDGAAAVEVPPAPLAD
jgi:poly(A) polymerase